MPSINHLYNYRLSKTKTIQLTQLDCFGLGEAGVGGVEVVVNSVGVGVVFNVDKVVVGGGEVCDVCYCCFVCCVLVWCAWVFAFSVCLGALRFEKKKRALHPFTP